MSRRLFVDCGFEVKAVGDDGHIEGLGAVFGNIDLGFDRIEKGAFRESIKRINSIPMLWQHLDDEPIGLWESMSESREGLKVSGQINLDTQRGREARSLTKQGAVQGLSIGYIPKDFEFEDEVRVLKRVDLMEVSLATFPMNPEARIAGVKHLPRKLLERSLREDYGLAKYLATKVAAVIRGAAEDDGMRDSRGRDSRNHESNSDLLPVAEQIRQITKELTS